MLFQSAYFKRHTNFFFMLIHPYLYMYSCMICRWQALSVLGVELNFPRMRRVWPHSSPLFQRSVIHLKGVQHSITYSVPHVSFAFILDFLYCILFISKTRGADFEIVLFCVFLLEVLRAWVHRQDVWIAEWLWHLNLFINPVNSNISQGQGGGTWEVKNTKEIE